MLPASLSFPHLSLHSAADVHEMFRLLGYDVDNPYAFECLDSTKGKKYTLALFMPSGSGDP